MSETKVENVTDFLDKLKEIQKNKHVNTELFFRGHADQAYEAEPTIFRKNGNGERNLLKNEKHLFNDMIRQCPEDFKDCQYTFEYLVKMQHYGLPTRLLDITSNALVALYFACCSLKCDKDGQVLVYSVHKMAIKNYNSDTVSVLSNIAQLDSNFELFTREKQKDFKQLTILYEKLRQIMFEISGRYDREKLAQFVSIVQDPNKFVPMVKDSQLFNIEESYNEYEEIEIINLIERIILIVQPNSKAKIDSLDDLICETYVIFHFLQESKERFIHFIKQEKSYFIDKLYDENHVQKIACVRAKLNNQRIIRQNGLFFLFGMGETKADTIKFSDYIKFEYTKSIREEREPSITEITNPTIIIAAELQLRRKAIY